MGPPFLYQPELQGVARLPLILEALSWRARTVLLSEEIGGLAEVCGSTRTRVHALLLSSRSPSRAPSASPSELGPSGLLP